jgi:hypothetical protein
VPDLLYITENGWPTSPTRSYSGQSEAQEIIIRTINNYRDNFNITHYILFDLRDADSLNQDILHQLRILRNDYTPKPGFEVYRQLIDELGSGRAKISEKRELEDP